MKKTNRLGRKRLSVDLPIDIHTEIKIAAIRHNCTVTAYTLRALLQKLSAEPEKRKGE